MNNASVVLRIYRFGIALLLVGLAFGAKAAPPESGVYWSANESGRGYQIEIQESTLAIYAYAYKADGSPIFYLAAGQLSGSTSFAATVYSYAGGQCYGCPYQNPTGTPAGTVTINFTSPTKANMVFLGQSISIERFDAPGYLSRVPDVMFGEWAFIDGSTSFPIYWGERVQFTGTYIGTDGTYYISGNRTGETGAEHLVLAAWSPSLQKIFVLLDSSSSYYDAWMFTYSGFNKLEGQNSTYLKGSSPSSWMPSVGVRLNYRSGPKFGTASAMSVAPQGSMSSVEADERKRTQVLAATRGPSRPLSTEEVNAIRSLEMNLPAARLHLQSAKTQ